MPASTAPFKTPQGLDELQLRTRRLGQRYRTVLLLVDGRRSVGEVLAMALSAGADTSHFEELVKLGLVEVPVQAMAPEPRDSGPVPLDVPTLTSVAFDVLESPVAAPAPSHPAPLPPSPITVTSRDVDDVPPVHLEPIRLAPPPAPEPAPRRRKRSAAEKAARQEPVLLRELPPVPEPDTGPDTVANPEVDPAPDVAAIPPNPPAPEPSPPSPPAPPAPVARPAAPPRAATVAPSPPPRAPAKAPVRLQPAAPNPSPPVMTQAVAPAKTRSKKPAKKEVADSAFQLADHARPREKSTEEVLCHEVRSLLVGAMGAEAALFSPLTLSRLRNAQTQKALISMVWEIERQRTHVNRSRAQLFSLERARELLGMGNTVVAGDSAADTTWPDTQGGG